MTPPDLFETASRDLPLADGAVLLRDFARNVEAPLLAALDQVMAAAPFRHMVTPGGHTMSVAMTNCGAAGWVTDRTGYRYDPVDPESRLRWPGMPGVFADLATRAAAQAGFDGFVPDACLINRYVPGAKLSLHQDRNERDFSAPIVSVSLGLPATFLFGGLRRTDRQRRLELTHGDVAVWGGPPRLSRGSAAEGGPAPEAGVPTAEPNVPEGAAGVRCMIALRVNGESHRFDGDPGTPLLWYLRDELGLTGAKFGCQMAACGACTVHVNGRAMRSCEVPLAGLQGSNVTTIEGLDPNGAYPLQEAWRALHVGQSDRGECGYCQAGQIMQAAWLLNTVPAPTDEDIDAAMAGNLCRCRSYAGICAAIGKQRHRWRAPDVVRPFRATWDRRRLLGVCEATTAFALARQTPIRGALLCIATRHLNGPDVPSTGEKDEGVFR